MGTAKSIEAYSVYEKYNSDKEVFILELSRKLNADFLINVFDKDFNRIGIEDRQTNYNKSNIYNLTITFDEYTISDKTFELPTYELTVPIAYEYEESLEFVFSPNNSIHIYFLTFEHLWGTFIENLKFAFGNQEREESIKRYKCLQSEYKNLLNKIGIEQICIVTHNYYEIECVTDYESYNKLNFGNILQIAKSEDNLKIFDFQQILETKYENDLDKEFKEESNFKIALID